MTAQEQKFRFERVPERPVPSLLRGFSAPVRLKYDYTDEELQFLMAHDSDGFSRWDAAQRLHQQVLLARVADDDVAPSEGYVEAFRTALHDDSGDRALLTEILTLPAESYLGDLMTVVDVEGIHAAREGLKTELARELRTDFATVYEANREDGVFRVDADAIARRRIKNLCLGYLAKSPDDNQSRQMCIDQYGAATNMTDSLAALSLVAHSDWPERDALLGDFEARWRHDPLVLDKWFALQATSVRADTLDQVKALMDHHVFSLGNPNRVRALVGSFVAGNPVRFHDRSGGGYHFLADVVLELDARNPQVAARLLRHMSRWRRYDDGRQPLMRAQLERVLAKEGLSKDTYEVATKSLRQD